MVIWGIADTPNMEPSAIGWGGRPRGAGTRIPGLGLPVVTASEPACAGTPEQGLSTGVDSPVTPGVAACRTRVRESRRIVAGTGAYDNPKGSPGDGSGARWAI